MSAKTKTSKTLPNIRAKLYSLKVLGHKDVDELGLIEKQLTKENQHKQEVQENKDDEQVPEDDPMVIENRLWQYFQKKIAPFETKVQKQKVNSWSKLMETILAEANKKIKTNQHTLEHIQSSIRSKYKEIHQLHLQLQQIRLEKKKETNSRRKRKESHDENLQKKAVLQENIKSLKSEIEEVYQHEKKVILEIEKIQQEKLSFLKHLLKQGYYKNNGVIWILEQMKELSYQPTQKDFPSILDARSRQYLFKLCENRLKKKKQKQEEKKQKKKSEKKLRSASQITVLAKRDHLNQIYNGTKQYLLEWVKNSGWKDEEQSSFKLPKLAQTKNTLFSLNSRRKNEQSNSEWDQKKRINHAYPQQLKEKVIRIQFGTKLEALPP